MIGNGEEENAPRTTEIGEITLKCLMIATFICLGLYAYVPGLTFIDLGGQVNRDSLIMLLIFPARAVGYILGFIIGAILFKWLKFSPNMPLIMFLVTFLMSATCFSITFSKKLEVVLMFFFLAGICMAVAEIGGNAICLDYNMKGTFFLILYAVNGLGGIISPLIAKSHSKHQVDVPLLLKNSSDSIDMKVWKMYYCTSIYYTYLLISALTFMTSLIWLVKYCFATVDLSIESVLRRDPEDQTSTSRNFTVFLAAILCFISGCIDFGYIHILPIYCILAFDMSLSKSSEVMALFMIIHTFARILSIFSIIRQNMIFLGIFLLFIGSTMLYTGSFVKGNFWLANIFIAFGSGPLFPSLLNRICERYNVTHRSFLPLFVMQSLSELVMPLLLGHYTWHYPYIVKYYILIVTVTYIVFMSFYFILYALLDAFKRRRQIPDELGDASLEEFSVSLRRRIATLHVPQEPRKLETSPVSKTTLATVKKTLPEVKTIKTQPASEAVSAHTILQQLSCVRNFVDISNQDIAQTLQCLEASGLKLEQSDTAVNEQNSEK